MNEAAGRAQREWINVVDSAESAGRSISEQLAIEFQDAPGGRNLLDIGLAHDLVDCAQIDRLNLVPELNIPEWRITVPAR
jgi:phosphosulfolactate phosphohydrolase-like enzyme